MTDAHRHDLLGQWTLGDNAVVHVNSERKDDGKLIYTLTFEDNDDQLRFVGLTGYGRLATWLGRRDACRS